jgi:WD40 repeat protein
MPSFTQELPFQKVELSDSVAFENQMQQLAAICDTQNLSELDVFKFQLISENYKEALATIKKRIKETPSEESIYLDVYLHYVEAKMSKNFNETFKNSYSNIWEVLFNPTGELLLASGSDNAIRIYDINSGKLFKTLLGHSEVPLSMGFSPNGKLLASAGDDKTIKIWDTKTWKVLHTLKGENQAIHSVVFLNNNRILSGGTDKKMLGEFLEYHFGFTGFTKPIIATLWDIENETILQTISEHTNYIGLGMDISSDGNLIATPSKDQTIKIWKL